MVRGRRTGAEVGELGGEPGREHEVVRGGRTVGRKRGQQVVRGRRTGVLLTEEPNPWSLRIPDVRTTSVPRHMCEILMISALKGTRTCRKSSPFQQASPMWRDLGLFMGEQSLSGIRTSVV